MPWTSLNFDSADVDINYDDPDIRVLSDKRVTTRKAHVCQDCKGPVRAGRLAYRVALIDQDGKFRSFVTHAGLCPSYGEIYGEQIGGDDDLPF